MAHRGGEEAMDEGGDRNNVSNLFPSAGTNSLRDFTEQEIRSLQAQLPSIGLSLDERRGEPLVQSLSQAIQRNQGIQDQVYESLHAVGRDDIVDILRPNQVVSVGGATAAPLSQPVTDRHRFPRGMRYKDLPYEIKIKLEQKLGVQNPGHLDYRKFGNAIGLEDHTLALLSEIPLERGSAVIKQWISQTGKKATLEALYAILDELKLTDVRDFLMNHMEDPY